MRGKKLKWRPCVAVILLALLLAAGCGSQQAAPVAESASEDRSEAMEAAREAETAAAAAEEEPRPTPETTLVGISLAKTENGDNDRLLYELGSTLTLQGFRPENIIAGDFVDSRTRQAETVGGFLDQGCSIVIVSPVSDKRIPDLADMITARGAGAVFVNCSPDPEEVDRWRALDMPVVWIGSDQADRTACQMTVLYDYSGAERGPDFNGDGHVGAVLIGGDENTEETLSQTIADLGSELRILGRTEYTNHEEVSAYTQDMLNEYRKEAELVLCSSEDAAAAAADGVQLRHRLVGRDILVIGTDAHEDACTAIINKLMSASTFTDFYEQAGLTAVAAKDLVEGNQKEKKISNVIFKVTEENAQEVLDQLWNTREKIENQEEPAFAGSAGTDQSAEALTGEEAAAAGADQSAEALTGEEADAAAAESAATADTAEETEE